MQQDILSFYKDWTPPANFDNVVLDYDNEKHNWQEFFLDSIRELKPELPCLEDIHKHFEPKELNGLRKHLERVSTGKEFCERLDSYFADYVAPIIGRDDYLVQNTNGIRLTVPNQEALGRLVTFHTGYWTGYNNAIGTVWTPVTKVWGTNTLQVLSWDDSVELMQRIHREKLTMLEIQELCEKHMYPVELDVGQAWLFGQGHLHGTVNNETDITRVSFDARYALPEYDLGPRRAGSFFRFQGQYNDLDPSDFQDGPRVAFVDQNSDYIGETPHYFIREFLLGVARSYNLTVNEWSNEYWGCTWMPKFNDFACKNYISGIILPSVHAFSCDVDRRMEIFNKALDNGQQLYFADEELLIKNKQDLLFVERIYNLKT